MVDVLGGQWFVEPKLAFEATVRIADLGLVASHWCLAVRKHERAELTVLLPLVALRSHLLTELDGRIALKLGVAEPAVRCEHDRDYELLLLTGIKTIKEDFTASIANPNNPDDS